MRLPGQFVQKWTSKFDGVSSVGVWPRDQVRLPPMRRGGLPLPPASSEDDGEEDKFAAGAQLAQGTVPAVPGATPAKIHQV